MATHMLLRSALLIALFSIVTPAFSAPPYQRPAGIADDKEPLIVAGYRALFTCSAHFIAGRPLDDIKKVEFVDVRLPGYPDPVIDEQRQLVTASDPSGKIVRIAAFRDTMGCTILPPHWSMSDVPRLPYVSYAPPPDVTNQPFPAGDRVGLPANGLDPDFRSLGPALERAFDGTYASRQGASTPAAVTTAVIVVKNGRIVAERYRPGFGIHSGYRTWSTAKSISAAVIGIASGQGLLDLDDRAAIPEWDYPGDPPAGHHVQAPAVDVERPRQRRQQHLLRLFRRPGCRERHHLDDAGSRARNAVEVRKQRFNAPAARAASAAWR